MSEEIQVLRTRLSLQPIVLIALVLLIMSCIGWRAWLEVSTFTRPRLATGDIEASVKKLLPKGSTCGEAKSWIRSHGAILWDHQISDNNGPRVLSGVIPNCGSALWRYDLRVKFTFDKNDRLLNTTVEKEGVFDSE